MIEKAPHEESKAILMAEIKKTMQKKKKFKRK